MAARKPAKKGTGSPSPQTANLVRKGSSSRMAKGRDAAKRTAANKAAVAKLNDADQASTDRGIRASRATKEHRALVAWEKGGRKGARPATPNYDAVTAGAPLGKPKGKARRSGGTTTRSARSARAQAALDAKKKAKNKRGPGKRITTAELYAYIAKVQKADADVTDEFRYAYWIEKLAVSRGPWRAAWTAVSKGQSPPDDEPKPRAKKAPAKKAAKATGKKATAKKATPIKAAAAKRAAAKKGTVRGSASTRKGRRSSGRRAA